jgi:hypothetical protein
VTAGNVQLANADKIDDPKLKAEAKKLLDL